jgi:hypothetical protein
MKGSCTLKRMALVGLLALSPVMFGRETAANAQDIPMMTVKIFNDSAAYNIYPVIAFPGAPFNGTDEWLQGFFGVSWADRNTKTYPNSIGTTRVYVNCCASGQNGIPPGGKVELKLPLYTPLFPPDSKFPNGVDPTKPGQVIEWWQGININLFQSNITSNKPPAALVALWSDTDKLTTPVVFTQKGEPYCAPTGPCKLNFFKSSQPGKSLGNPLPKDPQQLVEATLGANSANSKASDQNPTAPRWLFNPTNVDYDVSYVNSAYLPVSMEPVGNDKVGWVGAPNRIADFYSKVQLFLKTPKVGQQWPLYLDGVGGNGKAVPGKIPSVLDILAQDVANNPDASNDGQWIAKTCPTTSPPKPLVCGTHFAPYPPDSAPIKALVDAWKKCQQGGNDTFCTYVNDTTKLLLANFDNYVANYKKKPPGWECNTDGQHSNPHPLDRAHLTDLQILRHLYGWSPFSEYCGAKANLLEKTPGYAADNSAGYQKVKNEFDSLQYSIDVSNGKYGVFDPYVAFIHGPTLLNAPLAYAYSVDDAVGNVQTDGTGMIVAVGGLENLPNPDRNTPEVHVDFAYQSLSNLHKFLYYGKCTKDPKTPVNPDFSSFSVPVGVTDLVSNCVFSLKDDLGRIYLLQISPNYPPAVCAADKPCVNGHWAVWNSAISGDATARLPVKDSCALNKDPAIRDGWCQNRFAFQKQLDDARNTIEYHVNMGEPIQ